MNAEGSCRPASAGTARTKRTLLPLPAILLGLSVLFGLAGRAVAQVAAPPLNPFSFVTENPAAMQWGSPSRVGAGYTTAEGVTSPRSPKSDEFSGESGGLRLVGERFSFAVEGSQLQSDNRPYNKQSEFDSTASGALGVRLGDRLALGIGQSDEQTQFPGATAPARITLATPQFGASIRFGEWFFIGGALGTDYYRFQDSANAANDFSTRRDVTKYGAGIRTVGSVPVHLEYYVVDRSPFSDSKLTGGRENAGTGVLECNFGGFLLGYSATHVDRDRGQPTTDVGKGEIGYAPFQGLTFVASGSVATDKLPAGAPVKTQTFTTYTLALTYLFRTM